jgi:hypothetical protein
MGFAATFSGPAGSNLFGICLNGSCASIGSSLIPNSYRTITIFGPAVVSGTNVVKIYTQIENPETSVFLDDLYVAWTALPTPTATSPGIPTVTTTPSATPVPIPSSTLIPSPVPTLTPTLTPVPTVTLEPTATATPEPPKEGTPICGELSGLNIWTIRGSPYFLTCDSVLGLDSVLWMQPMSALELRGFALQINGLLIAFGIRIR